MTNVTSTTRLLRKTKPKGRHPLKALSPAFVRSAPPGRHADGNGSCLFVQPSGTRSRIQRLLIRGRRRELGLGSIALVPLAEAREKALTNRKLARQGGDPLAEKRRAEGIPTFAEAAMRVLEQKREGWRNPKHSREWLSSLSRFAFPCIDKVPVSEVTSADVLEILTPLWHGKRESLINYRFQPETEGGRVVEQKNTFPDLIDTCYRHRTNRRVSGISICVMFPRRGQCLLTNTSLCCCRHCSANPEHLA